MATKPSPEQLIAATLAAPFSPRSQGKPLSLRRLPDGGMVVIAADGQKLWFDAAEVQQAKMYLKQTTPARDGHSAESRGNCHEHHPD
jgi:predicted NAD/FAD-binding protein